MNNGHTPDLIQILESSKSLGGSMKAPIDSANTPFPVESFAHMKDQKRTDAFQHLMPTSQPEEGQQYAFEVDLDQCTGCKSCVVACHTLNGLDDDESFRDVGLLRGTTEKQPLMQSVTTACHHCLEPRCLQGCPVDAYEKNPITGIVKHLDDQCIGCQYCILTCPYEVPKFNERLGIVRKCDMCSQRLEQGEAPACVQSCPTEAIKIVTVEQQEIRHATARASSKVPEKTYDSQHAEELVPGAPRSDISVPTTKFHKKSSTFPPGTVPADLSNDRPAHGHRPLVWFLTLSQLSFGAVLASCITLSLTGISPTHILNKILLGAGALAGAISLIASTSHLGQPLRAWRVVLGIGHSWLSREVVAMGAFVHLLAGLAILTITSPPWVTSQLLRLSTGICACAGMLGVFTSAMLYIDTQRPLWVGRRTLPQFIITSCLLGTSFLLGVLIHPSISVVYPIIYSVGGVVIGGAFVSSAFDISVLRADSQNWASPLARPARILRSSLKGRQTVRLAFLILGALLTALAIASERTPGTELAPVILGGGAFIFFLAAELLGRELFFRASVSKAMPGQRR